MDQFAQNISESLRDRSHEPNPVPAPATRSYVDHAFSTIDQQIRTLTIQLSKVRDRNITDPHLAHTVKGLADEIAALRQALRRLQSQQKPVVAPKWSTEQLRQYAIEKLSKAFANTKGFDSKTGSLDCLDGSLFARGGVSVLPEARARLDEQLHRYIAILLDDPKIRSSLSAIVIEGHTDSTGSHKANQRLSLQRAHGIVQRLQTLAWAAAYPLEDYLRPKSARQNEPIMINGVENETVSRRIRILFELELQDKAKFPRKDLL
jgi:outer membrane protein OmpA-like peptidoglycan-associated protein